MKAIIDGLRYDTDKADRVGEITGNAKRDDVGDDALYEWKESLWMTPAGRFFLCGEGSGKTRWFRVAPPGNTKVVGDREVRWAIRALPEAEAQAWVEKYCSAQVYEQLWDVEDA